MNTALDVDRILAAIDACERAKSQQAHAEAMADLQAVFGVPQARALLELARHADERNPGRWIVAEVSTCWADGEPVDDARRVAFKFEHVLEVNRRRGYDLHDWRMTSSALPDGQLVETIVATFRHRAPRGACAGEVSDS